MSIYVSNWLIHRGEEFKRFSPFTKARVKGTWHLGDSSASVIEADFRTTSPSMRMTWNRLYSFRMLASYLKNRKYLFEVQEKLRFLGKIDLIWSNDYATLNYSNLKQNLTSIWLFVVCSNVVLLVFKVTKRITNDTS